MKRKITNWKTSNAIEECIKVLDNDGIIAYPTDTLYGLGCNAKSLKAIKKINKIKRRKSPISIIINSEKSILNWINVDTKYNKKIIFDKLSSSNTVIVPIKKGFVSDHILGNDQTLGVRIPHHEFCFQITEKYPNPITTTSINRTGEKPLTNPNLIRDKFGREIDLIIEDGIIDNKGSKIYLFKQEGFKLLRS